ETTLPSTFSIKCSPCVSRSRTLLAGRRGFLPPSRRSAVAIRSLDGLDGLSERRDLFADLDRQLLQLGSNVVDLALHLFDPTLGLVRVAAHLGQARADRFDTPTSGVGD